LNERNELLLVCDTRQNIYQRDIDWTDGKMRNVKFRGDWGKLKENKSYRLPNQIVQVVNDFAVQFLEREAENNSIAYNQMELFDNPQLIWENVSTINQGIELCEKAYNHFFNQGIQPSDIIFLIPDHKIGWQLVGNFESKGINVNHVFENPEKNHYHKKSFWMGDSRLKMSTIHSFKGSELKTVILLVSENTYPMNTGKSLDYLVYTALSRSLKDLCVINCCNKYDSFGSTWQQLN
jgi:superfamily I DNA and RNA helicase